MIERNNCKGSDGVVSRRQEVIGHEYDNGSFKEQERR
jgi:hypothetical protein